MNTNQVMGFLKHIQKYLIKITGLVVLVFAFQQDGNALNSVNKSPGKNENKFAAKSGTANRAFASMSKLNFYAPPPPNPITALPDSGTVNGVNGSATLVNIYDNDSLNNLPVSGAAIKLSMTLPNAKIVVDTLTGIVSVLPGLAAGDYVIPYSICDTSDLLNCATSQLTVHVLAPSIIANAETIHVNGYNGQPNLINVLLNDSFNNLTVISGPVQISLITAASSNKITLNTSNGNISVASGLQAGNYTLVYSICDSLNPSNCDTAQVNILSDAPVIEANGDFVSVNGYNGSLNVLNIYANDNINSTVVTPGKIVLSLLSSPTEPGILMNTNNGKISVFPMTPAGVYQFIYRICDTLNPGNCDTSLAVVEVLAPSIVANNDQGSVNGYIGTNNLINVFSNDSLNNKGTNLASVNLSLLNGSGHPGVMLNLGTGIVSVSLGTPAAVYTIDYIICDTLNPGNCDTAEISINVTAPAIKAHADFVSVNGYNGNPSLINVLANDSINGISANTGSINLSLISGSGNSGINLNLGNGVVSVNPYVQAGNYSIQYKICDTLNPGNCDSAILNINVSAPIILGNSDFGSANGLNGQSNLLNVFANDSINGQLVSNTGVSTSIIIPFSIAGISLDTASGFVSVAPFTPAGNYTLIYRICDTLNPSNCDTALLTIHLTAPIVQAFNDTFDADGYLGTVTPFNIWQNDSLNQAPLVFGSINISLSQASPSATISLNPVNGLVTVAPYTPAGNFTLHYQICDTLNPGNCDTGIVYIRLSAPLIEAIQDTLEVNGFNAYPNVLNVLGNDSLSGVNIPTNAVVIRTVNYPASNGIVLDTTTGNISITPRIAAGSYFLRYSITDTLNPTNRDTASVVVIVNRPVIIAGNENLSVNSYDGGANILQVLSNDSLNGDMINRSEISLQVIIPASHPGVWLNDTTGMLNVKPFTPAGLYTISYKICDTLNPGNCDSISDTIEVYSPLIVANIDSASIIGYDGSLNLLNILSNDSINYAPFLAAGIKITTLTPASAAGIILNDTTGIVRFEPRIASGIYTIEYRICDTLNTGNCDTAIAVIQVLNPEILAQNDTITVNNYFGTSGIENVLLNDSIHHLLANSSNVYLHTYIGSGRTDISLDTSNGYISVATSVPSGIYHIHYILADTLNPGNTDTALVYIHVVAPPIFAFDDTIEADGYDGNLNALNILNNDTMNNTSLYGKGVNISILNYSGSSHIVLNTGNGQLSVFPGTLSGNYQIRYQVCDTLNPGNCDTAIINIQVTAPTIVANNDSATSTGFNLLTPLLNIYANDSIHQHPANSVSVKPEILVPFTNSSIWLDLSSGNVSILNPVSIGIYTLEYRICDTLNTGNCDTAMVVLNINSEQIIGNDDTISVNGYPGMVQAMQVLGNDTLNGNPVILSQIRIQEIVPAANPGIKFDINTGWIDIDPRTAAGNYIITYSITDTLNLNNSDTSTVLIQVYAIGPVALADSVGTPSKTSVDINPLLNDSDVDGNLNIGSISILMPPLHGNAVVDANTGIITYTPDPSWAGYDTLYYTICDSGMVPVLCENAMVVIYTLDSIHLINSIITNNKCFGDSSGSIELFVIGGMAPYSISWNTIPVQTGSKAINLKAGTYDALISDANNQTLMLSLSVTQPTQGLNISSTKTDPLCYGAFNGSIQLNISGGTTPYTYLWSNGSILPAPAKLGAGNYQVVVTDSNGCKGSQSVNLSEPDPLSVQASKVQDVVCKSSLDGSITIEVSGGLLPYSYLWSTGDTIQNIYEKSEGFYIVRVSDKNGCTTEGNYQINFLKENCDHNVFVPQGFSPDGDGVNETFVIEGIEKYPESYLRIYNRWGGLVFEEKGYKNTWKGTVEAGVVVEKGDETLPTGTYFYVLNLGLGIKPLSGFVYLSK